MPDYYQILEVPRTASISEIKASYKRLAMKFHPDHNQNNPFAEDYFKRINEAYRVLSDTDRKYVYDTSLITNAYRPIYTPTTPTTQNYAPYVNEKDPKNLVSLSMKRKIAFFAIVFCGLMVLLGVKVLAYLNYKSAQFYFHEAEALYKEKEPRYALLKITNALSHDADFTEAYILRAKIHIDLFNYLKAVDDYDFLLEYQKSTKKEIYKDLYFKRGWCYFKAYDFSSALKDFEVAIQKEPHNLRYNFFKTASILKTGGKAQELCPDIIAAYRGGVQEADEWVRLYCTKH